MNIKNDNEKVAEGLMLVIGIIVGMIVIMSVIAVVVYLWRYERRKHSRGTSMDDWRGLDNRGCEKYLKNHQSL